MALSTHHVAVALVRRNGLWLVARRHDDVHLGGLWEFPGGKLEPGETPAIAAVRELREECAVDAIVERLLPAIMHEYPDRVVYLTPVVCRWTAGDGHPIGNAECRWVTLEEMRRLEMPALNGEILAELDGDSPPARIE
ncbi:MAG: (deoxy)nucleoside triphosphate pyrophosphohydrolase [Planctomycetes bacterium]|nr:(deoxy)nucleoside triphosphate pyrophosphohydrolase [Planctomycetota bacterium]